MRLHPLPLAVLALATLLTGCVSVPPEHPGPRHQPAGRSVPLPPAPSASPPPPVQPRSMEELAWIGQSPAASVTADRPRRPAARPEQPRTVPAPVRARPATHAAPGPRRTAAQHEALDAPRADRRRSWCRPSPPPVNSSAS
ncbi:hypothetical protein [Streptomyces cyaneofuscatus]|uniref:hypothetical protein n=1 Tax=Streptomyces cyaneofuscatus TaxID=66883 RepID=UPI00332E50A5